MQLLPNSIINIFSEVMNEHGLPFRKNISLIPKIQNTSLYFNISGGVDYQNVISGEEVPESGDEQFSSVQNCLRADGWSKIGYSGKHHIVFDMLGHFSFYKFNEITAKRLAIGSAVSLFKALDTDKSHLISIVHPQDVVSQNLLDKHGIAFQFNEKNTSIDPTDNRDGYRVEFAHNRNGGKPVEMWNIVFHQFDKNKKDSLSYISFDSGMSMDRLLSFVEEKDNNYKNSQWKPKVDFARSVLPEAPQEITYRFADMMNASTHLIGQNIYPGTKYQLQSKPREAISRKIAREVMTLIYLFDGNSFNQSDIVSVAQAYNNVYGYDNSEIGTIFSDEFKLYNSCLVKGKKALFKNNANVEIDDNKIEQIRSTFGVPVEIQKAWQNENTGFLTKLKS